MVRRQRLQFVDEAGMLRNLFGQRLLRPLRSKPGRGFFAVPPMMDVLEIGHRYTAQVITFGNGPWRCQSCKESRTPVAAKRSWMTVHGELLDHDVLAAGIMRGWRHSPVSTTIASRPASASQVKLSVKFWASGIDDEVGNTLPCRCPCRCAS